MSQIVGSRSSGSSGPSPKTSSRISPKRTSRSDRLSGAPSSDSSSCSSVRISLSARERSAWASASRLSRFSSLRWMLARSSRYCCRGWISGRAPGLITDAGSGGAIELIFVYLLPQRGEALESEKIAFGLADRRFGARIQNPPREAIELAGDFRVAGEGERHAGVERRGHRLVVARERVMNWMPERALDLFRRNRVGLGGAVQEHPHALAAGAELAHAIQQPLCVAHRRHVGVPDQEHLVGGVQRRDRAGIDLAAGIDQDVFVLSRQQPHQLFERAGVGRARPIEVIRSRKDLQAGLVLHDELAQELVIEAMQVVDGVENAEPRPDAEKQ